MTSPRRPCRHRRMECAGVNLRQIAWWCPDCGALGYQRVGNKRTW